MSYVMSIRVYQDETVIRVYEDTTYDYSITGRLAVLSNKISWEIRPNNFPAVQFLEPIEHLLHADEDELFQESCVKGYDPYYVKSAMKYIQAEFKNNHTDAHFNTNIELEY